MTSDGNPVDMERRRTEEGQLVTEAPYLTVSILESLLQAVLLVRNSALKLKCLSTSINLILRCTGSLLKQQDQDHHVEKLATILTSMYVKTLCELAADMTA